MIIGHDTKWTGASVRIDFVLLLMLDLMWAGGVCMQTIVSLCLFFIGKKACSQMPLRRERVPRGIERVLRVEEEAWLRGWTSRLPFFGSVAVRIQAVQVEEDEDAARREGIDEPVEDLQAGFSRQGRRAWVGACCEGVLLKQCIAEGRVVQVLARHGRPAARKGAVSMARVDNPVEPRPGGCRSVLTDL